MRAAGAEVAGASAFEGRNGKLSLHHHARLSDRKLAALHNFHMCRAEGTTAAERLFARAPPLFEQVLTRAPLPPCPRRRRPPRPKVSCVTPLAT